MVVTCATQLEKRVKSMKSAQEVHSIDSLVCYGIPLGPNNPLKLLELTLDFPSHKMYFEEQFNIQQCCFSPVYIDILLSEVVERLKKV